MLDMTRDESNPEIKSSQALATVNFENKENMEHYMDKLFPKFRKNFELLEYLDSGSSGIVYKGKTIDSCNKQPHSFKFCIKKNKKENGKKQKYHEIINQKKLHHKYISQILAFYKINDIDYFSVSELGSYGNLDNFLHKILKRNILSETFINYIGNQILEALYYMHKKKILHFNIKNGNIVLDSELNIKLIGFSSSIDYSNYKPDYSIKFPIIGTEQYIPPELMKNCRIAVKYLDKIDIYSLGATLYNLAFGHSPYGLNNINENGIDNIYKQLNSANLEFPGVIKISNYFKNFLENVLEKDYKKRYSIKDALNDPWIKGWNIINEEKENTGIINEFIKILLYDNIPKFNQYINNGNKESS